jgi:ribosome maturation factor RimP
LGSSGIHGKAAGRPDGKAGGGKAVAGRAAALRRAPVAPPKLDAAGLVIARTGWREAIERTVQGLHYEVVDVERAPRGLLRIYIDRIPGHAYPGSPSEFVTVEDCETVTRQLQYALEVDAIDYARLEVSSPGLDRPLRRETDYERFAGELVSVTLKLPFEGRKVFKGLLARAEAPASGWTLTFTAGKAEQVLGFSLDEVREARLVPVLDFKGRRGSQADDVPAAGAEPTAGPVPQAAAPGVDGG